VNKVLFCYEGAGMRTEDCSVIAVLLLQSLFLPSRESVTLIN